MKTIVGQHRDYGVLLSQKDEDGNKVSTLGNGLSECIVTGSLMTLSDQDVLTRLKTDALILLRKAEFFGLTPDQISSLFSTRASYSDEAKLLAQEYMNNTHALTVSEEFRGLPSKERNAKWREQMNPLLSLIGDTWANRFNFQDIVDDILR